MPAMRIRRSCIINIFLPLSSAAASTCIPRIIRTCRMNAIPIKAVALFSIVALVEKEEKMMLRPAVYMNLLFLKVSNLD